LLGFKLAEMTRYGLSPEVFEEGNQISSVGLERLPGQTAFPFQGVQVLFKKGLIKGRCFSNNFK
jgi:hypothetical protein